MAKRSVTSSFGVSERRSHDASPFYARRIYAGAPVAGSGGDEALLPEAATNRFFCADSRRMSDLPDGSVHLMVTSPPYAVGKDYDEDLSFDEYRELLRAVWRETYRVLAPGGRACVNVANLGRKPYIPLSAWVSLDMIDIGYHMRGEIIWDKGASAGGSCAWGSWQSASDPQLRDRHEYILVFSKESYKRSRGNRANTVGRDAFLECTQSVWSFPATSARRARHPAPFPEELPARLVQLYTFADDVVLDPFMGSGTTCVAAARARRRYVGYDIKPEYVAVAQERLAEALAALAGD